ncbi:sigma 54-interacting transcriptional regulator [Virgibacillus sp. C22-A2]|uniref:HTH-type transcriptional regulatory protein TyrR n=1 Tax=Virgibacillus tibetensis TaxID=3042313 RepID=A0ABU6KKI8_9BACI|nr:sigma 54-interacting transcriptional regulator [Virgibacillus sp. C22-A2]
MNFDPSWDWEEIVDNIYTDVIVTDSKGRVLYANASVGYWLNMEKSNMIGRSVIEMEKERIFYPSVVKKVLKTGERQALIQETQRGNKLFVIGNIIYDENENIKYIVTYSQDVTESEKLKTYVKMIEGEMESIKNELREIQKTQSANPHIVSKNEKMKNVISMIDRVAQTDTTVLLTGESGVGKSLLAEYLHDRSKRKGKLVTINCSSIPEALLESELFGYSAGAFTGANQKGKKGLVEEAKDGTLFLDEIGELPMNLQTKLLTLIQKKEFFRIGDTKSVSVDFRLVAATNANLKERIQEGKFREDLYFRLSVIDIPIPALRERREDLLSLIMDLTKTFSKRHQQEKELDHATIDCLLRYEWPGNVRELASLIERLILTVEDHLILPKHLPGEIIPGNLSEATLSVNELGNKTLPELISDIEVEILKNAMKRCSSTTKMAKYLGISQPTVVRKLNKYGLTR